MDYRKFSAPIQSEAYIKDLGHFIEKIKNLGVALNDILINFEVVSLFTMVPVNETINYLKDSSRRTGEAVSALSYNDILQMERGLLRIDRVAMGSPLSLVVVNYFIEKFEQALDKLPTKPKCWFRIQFNTEVEEDGKLPFRDGLVSRKADGTLGQTVYRKPTHTDRYLNKDSNHHPRQKRGIIKTLVERVRRICDLEDIEKELKHLEEAFVTNGYSNQEIKRAVRPNRHRGGDSHEKNAEQSGFA
ncbi:hypothetical protein NQ315_006664 [Exocentrus adspersus]|uniref:Helix-turn-helix domain-containing protein n=1 Tax=Exocentrus adspersus TaxID=1586481 RepID=A0AAV8WBA5_9CUCU|nr:hypothetical protein NQ315_006664 [Exocentrus adspersus]